MSAQRECYWLDGTALTFVSAQSDFLLDWKFVRSKVLIINRAAELNGFDLKTINRLEELLFVCANAPLFSLSLFRYLWRC